MRIHQIKNLWRKSLKTLRSAQILLDNQLYEDAISCAYYSVFYAAKAVLLVHNVVVTKSHRALRNAFGKHLIKTKELEQEWGKILSREYDNRILSDYNESYEASTDDAKQTVEEAELFINRIRDYLQSKQIDLGE